MIALTLTVTPRGRQAPISRGDPSSQKGKLGLPDGVNSSSQAAAKWGVSTDSCPAVSAVCWDPSSLSGDNWSHSPPHVHPYRETEHPWARGTETQGKSKGVGVCVSVCVCVLPPEDRIYPRPRKRLSKTVFGFTELLQQRDPNIQWL